MAMSNIDRILQIVNDNLENAKKVIEAASQHLEVDAFHTLAWGDNLFASVAEERISLSILATVEGIKQHETLTEDELAAKIVKYITNQALESAQTIPSSISI
jgi:hypothetical protein